MIELKNVTKTYDGDVTGVDNLSLTIEDGEFVFLVGESGSGKSTLLKLLMRELVPSEGSITIDGKKSQSLDAKKWLSSDAIWESYSRITDCCRNVRYTKM